VPGFGHSSLKVPLVLHLVRGDCQTDTPSVRSEFGGELLGVFDGVEGAALWVCATAWQAGGVAVRPRADGGRCAAHHKGDGLGVS
jgi:hypothetical protein